VGIEINKIHYFSDASTWLKQISEQYFSVCLSAKRTRSCFIFVSHQPCSTVLTPTEFFLAPPRTPTLLLLWIRSCHFCHETLLDLPNVAHVYCSGSGVTVALDSRKLALSSHQNLLAQEFQNKLWDIQSITDISELLIFSLLCMPFYRNIVTTTIFCFS
jgi:hypothetical protein